MLSQQESTKENDCMTVETPPLMCEQEFLLAVSMLDHAERMEFLRCMDATH
jgi:hypothetical protein